MRCPLIWPGAILLVSFLTAGCGGNNDTVLTTGTNCSQYQPEIMVNSISPTAGPKAGGIPLTINGQGFDVCVNRIAVTVGGSSASDLQVLSGNKIVCVIPPGTGKATVSVLVQDTYSGKNAQASKADAFEYQ
jgi:hypothetical protein